MKRLNKSLFWDVKKINPEENESFVIGRILNFGDIADLKWAIDFYGEEKIKNTVRNSRSLDPLVLEFLDNLF